MIEVEVNGERRECADGVTLAALLDELGLARPGVAVALDGVIVRRGDWAGTAVPAGGTLDVLTAVQGG